MLPPAHELTTGDEGALTQRATYQDETCDGQHALSRECKRCSGVLLLRTDRRISGLAVACCEGTPASLVAVLALANVSGFLDSATRLSCARPADGEACAAEGRRRQRVRETGRWSWRDRPVSHCKSGKSKTRPSCDRWRVAKADVGLSGWAETPAGRGRRAMRCGQRWCRGGGGRGG